jgi:probable HAF family extracellular repeat protein
MMLTSLRAQSNVIALIAILAAICLLSPRGRAVEYLLSPLLMPAGYNSVATGINDSGDVCGISVLATGAEGVVIWRDGATKLIAPHPTISYMGDCSIDAAGDVSGFYWFNGGAAANGFLYSKGKLTGIKVPGATITVVQAMSQSGYMVGYGSNASNQDDAFIYSGGTFYYLGDAIVGSGGYPDGVNDSGQIAAVGSNGTVNEAERWDLNSSFGIESVDFLGELGGPDNGYISECSAINNNGDIAGWALAADNTAHACLWQGDTAIDLGVAPGYTFALSNGIDSNDDVCGYSYTAFNATQTAFISYDGGQATDLNTLVSPTYGWTLQSAVGINDYGQIAATGYNTTPSNYGSVVLSPIATDVTSSFRVKVDAFSFSSSPAIGKVTIRNKSSEAVNGPIDVVFTNLTPGDTIVNATGTVGGNPYIQYRKPTVAAGDSVALTVKVSAPTDTVSFGVDVQSGFESPAP